MSAPIRRCLSSATYGSYQHNKFSSLVDTKIEDLAPVQKHVKPLLTVQSAKEREIHLVASIKHLKATPCIYDVPMDHLVTELKEVQRFIAANKQ